MSLNDVANSSNRVTNSHQTMCPASKQFLITERPCHLSNWLFPFVVHAAANDALQEIIRHEASSNRVKFVVAGLPRSFADERIYIPQRRWRRSFMYVSAFIWPDIYIPPRRERPNVMCTFISPVEPACFNTCTSLNEDDDSKHSDVFPHKRSQAYLGRITPLENTQQNMIGTCYPMKGR